MSRDGIRRVTIPTEELRNMDDLFYRQLQMKQEKAEKKYGALLGEAKEEAYDALSCEGIFDIFKLEKREGNTLFIEGGESFTNKMMARVFAKSEEVVIYAATVHGYVALEENAGQFMKQFIYDAWGTAFAESAAEWLREYIKADVLPQDVYCTCSWSPGQHGMDIHLQRPVFRTIAPETIGITLNDSCMMHPKKSVSGFFGVGKEKNLELIRACDFCDLRETCPSAYATAR